MIKVFPTGDVRVAVNGRTWTYNPRCMVPAPGETAPELMGECACMCACACACVCVCVHVHVYVCVYVYMCMCVCECVHVCTCVA